MAEERKRRRRRKKKPVVDPQEITPGDITELLPVDMDQIFIDAGCTREAYAKLHYIQMNATKRVRISPKRWKEVPDHGARNPALDREGKRLAIFPSDKQEHTVTGNVVFGWDTDSERS